MAFFNSIEKRFVYLLQSSHADDAVYHLDTYDRATHQNYFMMCIIAELNARLMAKRLFHLNE